jgi:hypothetical protein
MKLAPHILECPLCSGKFRFVDTFRNHVRYDHADEGADDSEVEVVQEVDITDITDMQVIIYSAFIILTSKQNKCFRTTVTTSWSTSQ